ncbi:RICIN domain-containing protein [Chitinivorax sp. B]|uniref:RICIN domain-containing protein n=1 Tax=Chitinivorax sp. B TaxID=2502235 RepID=UPI0010F81797|nr:RICIN domain-containing protein [Chitinivorax sp. B]
MKPQTPLHQDLLPDETIVRSIYRDLPSPEPSAVLDAAILQAARDAVTPTADNKVVALPRRRPWYARPLAAAATIIIGLGMVLEMNMGKKEEAAALQQSAESPMVMDNDTASQPTAPPIPVPAMEQPAAAPAPAEVAKPGKPAPKLDVATTTPAPPTARSSNPAPEARTVEADIVPAPLVAQPSPISESLEKQSAPSKGKQTQSDTPTAGHTANLAPAPLPAAPVEPSMAKQPTPMEPKSPHDDLRKSTDARQPGVAALRERSSRPLAIAGQIWFSATTGLCLTADAYTGSQTGRVLLQTCDAQPNQSWRLKRDGLMYNQAFPTLCLAATSTSVGLQLCGTAPEQKWHRMGTALVTGQSQPMALTANQNQLSLTPFNAENTLQQWGNAHNTLSR